MLLSRLLLWLLMLELCLLQLQRLGFLDLKRLRLGRLRRLLLEWGRLTDDRREQLGFRLQTS